MLEVLVHRSFLGSRSLVFFSVAFFALFPHVIAGQSLINGQTFTNGLAVIDSPSPSNPGHAGSTISIAVDVSGNGKLQQPASLPGSGLPTSYDSLEIYLVSVQANINMTVSAGPAFLNSESGSTVKHLNWPIPTCISDGNYNLTFYESSHFNGQGVFAITAIPIPISNPNPSGQCPGLNPVQAQPQPSSPLSQSPFAPNSSLAPGSASGSSASPLPLSITATKTGMITVVGPTAVTLTLTVSGGVIDLPTVTVTAQPTPSTVLLKHQLSRRSWRHPPDNRTPQVSSR
ncbi:hypothetical protein C8R43DRAFT_1044719 [Mycena crocata]|nr:hypothetical protein C8R43DRAFT_1044719 [Mycena crocata]